MSNSLISAALAMISESREVNDILTAGYHPITLGEVVLRSETAALYAVSTINHEMQFPGRL